MAKALYQKGVALVRLSRSEDAIAAYSDLIARFGTAAEPALHEQAAKAESRIEYLLGQVSRSADAIAVYDDLIARFGSATEPALRELPRFIESLDYIHHAMDGRRHDVPHADPDSARIEMCVVMMAPKQIREPIKGSLSAPVL